MRQIKFRAFYDNRMHDNVEALRILYNNSTEGSLTPKYPIMQFTGLLDKNGKEIYEGDIISPLGAYVLWDSELACWCFNFKSVDTPNTPLFYRDTISNAEVIGNIHESNTVEQK